MHCPSGAEPLIETRDLSRAYRMGSSPVRALDGLNTLEDWEGQRPVLRRQFMRSMGLDPRPAACDPEVVEHGGFAGRGYTAKRVSYLIMPDCRSSGTVYYPDPHPDGKLPIP